MNIPAGPHGGPFQHPHTGGFGFAPPDRRSLHQAKRQAKRELLGQLRAHGAGFGADLGPGFGPGFGGGPGFGFGFGPGPRGRRRGHDRGRRGGDVRAAILALLAERPMHGYEMIRQIAERSQGLWRPSPGSVYPTLQLLVDEGLIVGNETQGSKRLFELTESGRAAAEEVETPPWQEITEDVDPVHASLRTAAGQLFGAVAQAAQAANSEQQQRIVDIVNRARREVYTILGESD